MQALRQLFYVFVSSKLPDVSAMAISLEGSLSKRWDDVVNRKGSETQPHVIAALSVKPPPLHRLPRPNFESRFPLTFLQLWLVLLVG
ncbi:hypothetical protein VTH06DRAFT_819 [Thermothelomyces fergusii]